MLSPGDVAQFRFGPFELYPATGELLKAGVKVKLQPQPFRLLLLLVSHHGELVTREQIREALWSSGTTVEFDQSLNFCIRQIRTVLGEDAHEPRFIETLPKRGYRFIAPIIPTQLEESTPRADEAESKIVALRSRRRPVWWVAALAATATTVFLVYWVSRTGGIRDIPKSILIRPLVSLGLPQEDVWFSDALTQQLIGAVEQTKTVRVIPWSSSLALKGQSFRVGELGKRFQVDAILEGSIGRSGERLRIVTRLVDVATERTLWSHQDEREARDLAHVQDDILAAIAGTLKLRLAEAAIPVARRRPQDVDTYNLYLKAVLLGDQFSRKGGPESISDFEEVIRRAPDFAPAYAGLANALAILPFFETAPAKQTLARARDAAERAIALDPSLATAHAALAHSLFNSWDWNRSEKEFQTALSMDPDSAIALHLYGLLLGSQGRAEEAIRQARRATDLAPTSALVSYSLAEILLHADNFDEAIAQARRTMELDRGFYLAYSVLGRAYTLKGMRSQALQTFNDWERQDKDDPVQPLWKARALASAGQRDHAMRLLDQWRKANPRAATPPMAYVAALLACGDKDGALNALRASVGRHVPSMVWLKSTPELSAIRSDRRFTAILASMSVN